MRIKVTLERPQGSVDLVLTADADATVGDVASALASRDPRGDAPSGRCTLAVLGTGRVDLDPGLPLADSGIRSGNRVAVSPVGSRYEDAAARPAAVMTIQDGPDAGRRFTLSAGNRTIGRSPDCDLRLSDTLISRRHARVFLTPGSAEFLDLGSANGLLLNDEPAVRGHWLPGDRLQLGETVLGIEFTAPAAEVPSAAGSGFNRSPVVTPGYPGETLVTPELPEAEQPQRFPVLPMLAPIVLGGVLFAVTRNAATLALVALSPVMMVANVVESRWSVSRGGRGSMGLLRRELTALDAAARAAQDNERLARNAEHPPTLTCLSAAVRQEPLLWSRRPDAPRFLDVRVGAAALPSRLSFGLPSDRRAMPEARSALTELTSRYADIADVPVALSLTGHGCIGIAGELYQAMDLARAVACEVAALHSPAEVVLTAFCGIRTATDWDWLKWLPHTSSPHSPLAGPHLVAGPDSPALLSQLEDLALGRDDRRTAARRGLPAVVVLIDSAATADRARLVELSRIGPPAGIYCVWLAPRAERLPASCLAFAALRGQSAVVTDSLSGTTVTGIVPDGVDAAAAVAFSTRLSPLTDAGAVLDDDSDLPRSVSWLELHDPRLAQDESAVIERWQESRSILTGSFAAPPSRRSPGSLRAIVGHAAGEPHALDLRTHGPHALLGGTTGAGKSELLQAWILSMAAAHSPQRVTFLLVDYKGGSAFRDCVHLPHTVGLVTDLGPHLVRRALISLRAELTYREQLLNRKRVKDLVELERTGDPETPPSLVIVIDEFAALVQDVPEFVTGVVNVAQRGRSLGLHLVLATQRPAGVIKDNLRANTNLRIALRMADESDSDDVLGSPEAAHIDPELPGRAVSKTGPGRLVPFQVAHAGGHTRSGQRRPDVRIEELAIGAGRDWPEADIGSVTSAESGPTDSARVTETIRRAAATAGLPSPRRPWLDELAACYDLIALPTSRRDDELVFGVIDEPAQQRQVTAAFYPDREGSLAVFGTGGSGKSTTLRSFAVAATMTLRGGPCHVYGLDFSSRGLSMLTGLPHVGSVIPGDEPDRVTRLLRTLSATADDRARRWAAVQASTITDYRRLAGKPDEPRLLVLLDGYPAFRQQFEMLDGGKWFDLLTSLAADGRPLGIHVILTADRPGALPPRLNSAMQRRLILRLADDNEYALAGAERGMLVADSPPGRAIMGGTELQVAVLGGSADITEQAHAIERLAGALRRQQVAQAAPVGRLPDLVRLSDQQATVSGRPVIGIADEDLGPATFAAEGAFLISGPPDSGRTTTISTIVTAMRRARPEAGLVFFGGKRSPLIGLGIWQQVATDASDVAEAAAKLEQVAGRDACPPLTVIIEGIADFLSGPADMPLTALIKALVGHGHLVVAEGETSTLSQSWPLLNAVKAARSGIALQPGQADGLMLYKTDFPKIRRGEFPPGRGLLVENGRVRLVQIAIPE